MGKKIFTLKKFFDPTIFLFVYVTAFVKSIQTHPFQSIEIDGITIPHVSKVHLIVR